MSDDRWLIVGLGNPGPEYARNRHNVGYWTVNRLARLHGIKFRAARPAAVGQGSIEGVPVVLLKPRTFVNRSGDAVAPAMRKAGVDVQGLLVVYDELDLPAGRLRIKSGGGHGGHNGLKSIGVAVGSTDFPRIRIGIGRPHVRGEPTWEPEAVADWVLSDLGSQEARTLHDAVSRAAGAVETVLREGLEAAMNRYNK